MKKIFIKAVCLFSAFVFVLSLCGCAAENNELSPTDRFFINDFANIVESDAQNEIYSLGAALEKKTGAQVVAVTVETTDGQDISEYATELGRKWELGDKEKDNGVLILIASEDRKIQIAVGYGLEGALPDSKTGRLLDVYAVPYLKNDRFSTGLLSVYKAVINEVYIEYGIEPEEGYVPIDQIADTNTGESASSIVFSWFIMIIIILIINVVFSRRRGFPFFFFGGPGGFGGSGFSSGGFSGGGFRGGGGSFGGGGAGRGF